MIPFVKANANNKILNKLIFEHCLSFGRNPKLNNKKINHYIFGTRQKLDIFKLYELRYLLLKIYPLIHILFLQERLNTKKKKKFFFYKNFNYQTQNLPNQFQNKKNFHHLKDRFNRLFKEKVTRPLPPKILFATTTKIYSEIVSSAAKKCGMPFHVNRWLSGAVTAASYYLTDQKKWSFLINNSEEKYIVSLFKKHFGKHKKNFELQNKKILKYQLGRKPTLIIVPDISNNEMILKETNLVGIPALGLVNSDCRIEIAYPIFANDISFYSIHFFCHFLSALILKEFAKYKYKIYTKKKERRALQFMQINKDIFKFNTWTLEKEEHQNETGIPQPYSFKGKYFIEHFSKPRRLKKKKNKTFIPYFFRKKPTIKTMSPKKLISIENRKRLRKNKINFYLKKRIVKKIKLIQKVRDFNFPKIKRAIKSPKNKPTFRYWNRKKFWFANVIKFSSNTPFAYPFRRYKVKKILRNKIRKAKREERKNKKKFYKKRWFPKKSIKKYIK